MPLVVREIAKSRKITVDGKGASGEVKYIAYREDDIAIVRAALDDTDNIPATFEGLSLIGVDPTDLGGGVWDCTAKYALPDSSIDDEDFTDEFIGEPGDPPPDRTQGEPDADGVPGGDVDPGSNGLPGNDEPLGPEWSFTTIGGTEKILRSLETVDTQPPGARNFDRAINCTDSEGVQGVDIITSHLELTCKKTHAFMTLNYMRLLSYFSGTVNSLQWGPFEPGELLFLGAETSQDGQGRWATSYRFLQSPNEVDVQVDEAGDVVFANKEGHQYIWASITEKIVGNALTRVVQSAYLEKVYLYFNFNKLWI